MMDRMINKGAVLPFNAIVLADTPLKALPKTWEIGKERGWAFKADSIEELAQQIGVPPENLKDTMKKVNGYAEKGHDPSSAASPSISSSSIWNTAPTTPSRPSAPSSSRSAAFK